MKFSEDSRVPHRVSDGPIIYFLTLIRAIIGILLIIPWTIYISVVVIVFGYLKRDDIITYHMVLWSKVVLWYFGVTVIRNGLDKLPTSGGAVLAFNHQSDFDIPAVTAYTDRRLRYGAKIELFSVPFFGPAIRAAGCLPIARENRSEVLKVYEVAAASFQKGVIFALAPEGTRQSEPVIGNFKKGPFIFACNAGVPVVPVVIEGADRVLPKNRIFVNLGRLRRTIQVEGLDPIFPSEKLAREASPGASTSAAALDMLTRTREAMMPIYTRLQASNPDLQRK